MNGKRILICEFSQESNTFNPIVMPVQLFGKQVEDKAIYARRLASNSAIGGAAKVLQDAGVTVVPTFIMSAPSGGKIADAALEQAEKLMAHYMDTESYDGILTVLHGATCTESDDDACGAFLTFLRQKAGDKPIVATCDLHANITDKMLAAADGICGYQTYPHTDYYYVGCRAANLMLRKLQGLACTVAVAKLPMLVPPAGYTTLDGAFCQLMQEAKALVTEGKLLDVSIFVVQPWLDISELNSTVIATAEDPAIAQACAAQLAEKLFAIREQMEPKLWDIDEIINIAEKNTTDKPVILADSADSPNGGAVGDSPVVALRLQERGSQLRTAMFVVDPQAVEKAFAVGVGNEADFSIGAGYTPDMPGPFRARGRVCSLHDGYFRIEKNKISYLGLSAVVRFGNIDILLCDHGASTGQPMIFRSFGMEPLHYDLVVVKANTSFRVPYSTISDLTYVADTPGACASNLKQFSWKHIPKGMFPFDLPEDYQIADAVVK